MHVHVRDMCKLCIHENVRAYSLYVWGRPGGEGAGRRGEEGGREGSGQAGPLHL